MRVKWPDAPDDVRRTAFEAAPMFLARDDVERTLLLDPSSAAEQITQHVFWVEADSVADATPNHELTLAAGWRFLSRNTAGVMAATYVSEADGIMEVTSVSIGRRLQTYFEIAHRTQTIAKGLPGDDCEGRVLSIPCLLVDAAWLVPQSGDDWMIPWTLLPELNTKPAFTGNEFRAVCARLAEERAKRSPSLRYGPPRE